MTKTSEQEKNTCGDCARFKIPHSGCTYSSQIAQGIIDRNDKACTDFFPNHHKGKGNPLNSQYFDDKAHFQPVAFAKDLMKEHIFKTTRDNETLYVWNPNRGIYEQKGEVVIKEAMTQKLDDETRKHYYDDVEFYIKGATLIDRPNQTAGAVAVQNGVLNVKLRTLEPFDPSYWILTSIPVTYDPKATCPKIVKFLVEVVGEEQLVLIQEHIGYCLLNELLFHKALMLIGEGRNGKTTLLRLILEFLGKDNVSNVSLQAICYNRFSVAELYGKMANIYADLPTTVLTQTGIFKMLTGNDPIEAEEKFKKPFSFPNVAKLLFSCNQVPPTLDDTPAFFRRWNLIACDNIFVGDNCNPNILEEITTPEELSGLLNWALDGLSRLLQNWKFSTTENIEELRTQYIRKSNSARAFIEENYEYNADPDALIQVDDFYEKFVLFCRTNKLPSTEKGKLTKTLNEVLPQVRKVQRRVLGKREWFWEGIKEKVVTPEETPETVENTTEKEPSQLSQLSQLSQAPHSISTTQKTLEKGDEVVVTPVTVTQHQNDGEKGDEKPVTTSPAGFALSKTEQKAELEEKAVATEKPPEQKPFSEDGCKRVCFFCGQPIEGDIHSHAGANFSEPCHPEPCERKWRQLKGYDVENG